MLRTWLVALVLLFGSHVAFGAPAAAPALPAAGVPLELALLASADDSAAKMTAPAMDSAYLPLRTAQATLRADDERVHWLRLRTDLPAGRPQVLVMERVPLDEIMLYLPDSQAPLAADSFFQPAAGEMLRSSYAFELPAALSGPQELFLSVRTTSTVRLSPKLLDEADFRVQERRGSNLAAAVYGSLLAFVASCLWLYLGLCEGFFLRFMAFALALLAVLLALSGQLYETPVGALLAGLGGAGLFVAGHLGAATAVGYTQSVLRLERVSLALARRLDHLRWAAFALAVLCLFDIGLLHALSLAFYVGVLLLLVGVSAWVWSRGEPLAAALCVAWGLFALAFGARLAGLLGWMPEGAWSIPAFQLAVALATLVLSIGLADRILEFRRQHDRVHAQQAQSEADLQIEQRRRQFADALREALRTSVAAGDLEWRAFKQLLQTLGALLPNRSVSLIATGYRGFDYLLAEPMQAKTRYCALMQERGTTLKSICRSRSPVQLRLDADDAAESEQALYAIVPMQIGKPGWGALLIERAADEVFTPGELALASEFVALALSAADDGAQKAELRRSAELDPLTGALNRRAGDVRLEQSFRRTIADRQPLALVFADLDHFKQVNDRYGHAAGDECLRALAEAVRPLLGADDMLIRWGGEEFLIVLPNQRPDQARELSERIRTQVAMLRIKSEGKLIKLTVSIGLAGRLPSEDRPQPLLERADRALYTAKRNGRNQVQVAPAYAGQGEAPGLPPVL